MKISIDCSTNEESRALLRRLAEHSTEQKPAASPAELFKLLKPDIYKLFEDEFFELIRRYHNNCVLPVLDKLDIADNFQDFEEECQRPY